MILKKYGANINFIYINRNNTISEYEGILVSHNEYKFYICPNYVPGETHFNTLGCFLYDSVLLDLDDFDGSVEDLITTYNTNYEEYVPPGRGPVKRFKLNLRNKPEILFSGIFKKPNSLYTEDELIRMAIKNGFNVNSIKRLHDSHWKIKKSESLGSNVYFLVCRPHTPPTDMLHASKMGSILITEQQFLHMIENGGELIDDDE